MKLSFTRIEKYLTCPALYDYYYNQGYRESIMSSALFFGTNIGNVLQYICLSKKESHTEELQLLNKYKSPMEYLEDLYRSVNINGETFDLAECTKVSYFKNDYQDNILNQNDRELINLVRKKYNVLDKYEDLFEKIKEHKNTEEELKTLNFMCWVSCKRKSVYIISGFEKEILPKIHKVYAMEEKVSISNGVDELEGYLDIRCQYEHQEGTIKDTILDFKTSSKKYDKNALREKLQLSIYEYDKEVGQVGYLVCMKEIKQPKNGKRVGETFAEFQVLVDQVPEKIQEEMIAKIDKVCQDIKEEKFEPSYRDGCRVFGKRCFMSAVCLEGKSDKYIYKKGRDDKKKSDPDIWE